MKMTIYPYLYFSRFLKTILIIQPGDGRYFVIQAIRRVSGPVDCANNKTIREMITISVLATLIYLHTLSIYTRPVTYG